MKIFEVLTIDKESQLLMSSRTLGHRDTILGIAHVFAIFRECTMKNFSL